MVVKMLVRPPAGLAVKAVLPVAASSTRAESAPRPYTISYGAALGAGYVPVPKMARRPPAGIELGRGCGPATRGVAASATAIRTTTAQVATADTAVAAILAVRLRVRRRSSGSAGAGAVRSGAAHRSNWSCRSMLLITPPSRVAGTGAVPGACARLPA